MMTGQDVAVFGHEKFAVDTASDLDWFDAKSITIVTNDKEMFEGQEIGEIEKSEMLDKMTELGVNIITGRITELFGLDDNFLGMNLSEGSERMFDAGMIALGLYKINNELATMLGGKLDEEGYVMTDSDCRVLDNQENPIKGLYAVGDVRSEWNQIVIGYGDAERAIIHAYAYLF